ncbi:MAG: adenosylcobalamin-dependent ribonucleoside-diphosphate reductase [Polyangia bacterium]|jgi:ribonucleoside-diphosphate reductase alpha chain
MTSHGQSQDPTGEQAGETLPPISQRIWELRYRLEGSDATLADTFRRVARAVAQAELDAEWAGRFEALLFGHGFLPGGRILAGAGTSRRVTLFNCFVMGVVQDSMEGIFSALQEGAVTMQQGGGVGTDFSTLRPRGARALSTGQVATGPVSFMRVWDTMCATLQNTSERRGAMMATLRCDHPDIEEYIDAKRGGGALASFNLSVQVSDEFMNAVAADRDFALVFPADGLEDGDGPVEMRAWTGSSGPVACRVWRRVRARDLWQRIVRAAHESGEPGVVFVDRVNQWNNLWYRERITATNPCGELPLPPYGACNLGSLVLPRFVRQPFTPRAVFDFDALASTTSLAVRFLDDVIDISHFPLPEQAAEARATRRLGLGVTGLADALLMLGKRYDSEEARQAAAAIMCAVAHAAYRASIDLARERGAFPALDADRFLLSPFVAALPEHLQLLIRSDGIRNGHLLAVAPAGTISLLAGNVSSGIEPIFRPRYQRLVHRLDRPPETLELTDYAVALFESTAGFDAGPPGAMVDASSMAPEAHLEMQAALQPYVDAAISKTVNLPPGYDFKSVLRLFERAHAAGLKGLTVFPADSPIGRVLVADSGAACDGLACQVQG